MHGTLFGTAAVGRQHAHGTRGGAEGADDYAALPVRVRAEEGMGIGRAARGELVGVGHPVFRADLYRGKQPGPSDRARARTGAPLAGIAPALRHARETPP